MKIIQATHTTELAVGFGRKVKNLIDSEDFRDVFPDIKLASDAKASGRWSTNGGGEYYAGFSFGKGDIVDNELVNSVMTSSSYDFCAHCNKPTRL
jgi:hypothetical protein